MKKVVDTEQTLLESLLSLYPGTSKSSLREWLKHERVLVDEMFVRRDCVLPVGATIEVLPKKIKQGPVVVLYQDRYIVVVEKPEGLLSVATSTEERQTMHAFLKRTYPNVWPVHRLDRATSGVMVFALTEEAKEGLKQQFIKHSIYREYRAKVVGRMEGKGRWECFLVEDKNYHMHIHPTEGEKAITDYEVLESGDNESLVKFMLKTGKKNQIRVQAAHAGNPIVGDKKYGEKTGYKGRLKLHAIALEFSHPITQKKLAFNSPIPFI